jgi:predicted ester cyclase
MTRGTPKTGIRSASVMQTMWSRAGLVVNHPPINGIDAHRNGREYFFKAFPDNYVENNPYKVFFAQGEWTCSIAEFTGTHECPMMGLVGKMIPPTNKTFKVDFCTLAHWNNDGKIVEENVFYDQVGMMTKLGLM